MTDYLHAPIVVPPGKKTGALLRESKPGEWCPLASERIEIVPPDEWAERIASGQGNIRPFGGTVYDQDAVGSCAAESSTKSVDVSRRLCGYETVELNPWGLYHFSSGGVDRGSSIDTNLRYLRDQGVPPLNLWPRSKGWRTRPSAEAMEAAKRYRIEEFYDIASVAELGSALLLGFPVVFGWSGHSCIFLTIKSPTVGEYLNSWGNWGDQGYGRLAFRSVNWGYGAWAIKFPEHTP